MRIGQVGNSASDLDLIGADILGRILVVDDNESNRDIMLRRLQRQGYTVEAVSSGRSGPRSRSRSRSVIGF